MLARDVMTKNVVTVRPDTTVEDCARLLLDRRISAAPVVNESGQVVGIVSEGDLIHRIETETETRRPWWLELVSDPSVMAQDFVKSTGKRVADVMTNHVISVGEETPLRDIAELLDKRRIKRVPVVRGGKLVGVVSRADLVRALLQQTAQQPKPAAAVSDAKIREQLLAKLDNAPWSPRATNNVVVTYGQVEMYGLAASAEVARAIAVLAEGLPGVKAVDNQVRIGDLARYAV